MTRARILDLDAWDLPVDRVEEISVLNGEDGVAYLILEVTESPDLAVFSDPDLDLVLGVMGSLGDAVDDPTTPRISLDSIIAGVVSARAASVAPVRRGGR